MPPTTKILQQGVCRDFLYHKSFLTRTGSPAQCDELALRMHCRGTDLCRLERPSQILQGIVLQILLQDRICPRRDYVYTRGLITLTLRNCPNSSGSDQVPRICRCHMKMP